MGNKIIVMLLMLCSISQADPIRVLMIDAGVPEGKEIFGESVGKDISLSKKKIHEHATATFKFIMSGTCKDKSCLKPACPELILDWCGFMDGNKYYNHCLNRAIVGYYDIVNMSLSGTEPDLNEKSKVEEIAKNSLVIIAAGNRGQDKRDYPAAYATSLTGPIIAISAIDENGKRLLSSNKDNLTVDFLGIAYYYEKSMDTWPRMMGTSIAAALYTHSKVLELCETRKVVKHGKSNQKRPASL